MKSKNIKYLPAVDHIRDLAALLILFYHGLQIFSHQEMYGRFFNPNKWIETKNPLFSLLVEGHTAVALFMVLSGFIFAFGALGKTISYWKFIYNRFLRIYPLYLFIIFLGLYLYPRNFSLNSLIQTLLCLNYPLPGALQLQEFSAMFWAISVEFQFYLLFPFLLYFLQLKGNRFIYALILLLGITKILCAFELGGAHNTFYYYTIWGRLDQFLFGMLAAKIFVNSTKGYPKSLYILGLLVPIATMYAYHCFGGFPSEEKWKALWPSIEGISWAVFIYCYITLFNELKGLLSRILCRIGQLSYSIYLLHFALLIALARNNYFLDFGFTPYINAICNTAVILLPITLLISSLTFYVIEKPFLELRKKYYLS